MKSLRWFPITACLLAFGLIYFRPASYAQGTNVLHYTPAAPARAKIGGTVEVSVPLSLQEGYHVNSNHPSDEYLIPLKLTWSKGALEPAETVYPKPTLHKVQSEPKPLSVYSGNFELIAKFNVPATAVTGPVGMNGKLKYQACNDKMCLAPKDLDVNVQLDIVK
jgi:hypothetical protein